MLSAQFNVKVAYSIGFSSPETNNKIINEFNLQNAEVIALEMKDLGILHGIALGARYKLGAGAFELSWENLGQSVRAVGENINTTLFQEEVFYSFNQLSLGYENYFGIVGLGGALGFNKIRIKSKIANSDFKEQLVADSQLTFRFNLSLNFDNSNAVTFAIKPFIQFPLSDLDIGTLAEELEVSNQGEYKESFPMMGISFIFYNGSQ